MKSLRGRVINERLSRAQTTMLSRGSRILTPQTVGKVDRSRHPAQQHERSEDSQATEEPNACRSACVRSRSARERLTRSSTIATATMASPAATPRPGRRRRRVSITS